MKSLVILLISIVALIFLALRGCIELETRRTNVKSLSAEKLNSEQYHWSVSKGLISSVKNYKEAYDIDSNDWVAEFQLDIEESKKLEGVLTTLSSSQKYRCYTSLADWKINHDLCSYHKMIGAGFKGYYYSKSFCEAGCKGEAVLWVNEKTGASYIVGAPK